MSLDVQVVNPLIALIAGLLILLMPRLLNYVVAIYLIVIGVLGLRASFQHVGCTRHRVASVTHIWQG